MSSKEYECNKKNNIPELIKDLINEFISLTSHQVFLLKHDIKHEIMHDIKSALNQLFLALLCIFTGFCGLIFLGFFFVVIIASVLPLWMSILLIAIVYFISSLIFLIFVVKKRNIENIKHNLN